MTGTALVPSNTAIAQYGDRDVIKELGERVKRFLPNGSQMSQEEALSFAQTALALDLNPFAGEVWYIPRVGIVTGIAGYRKMARAQGKFIAETRPMSPEERDKHNLADGDLGGICELYRPDQMLAAVKVNNEAGKIVIPVRPVIGIGIWRIKELATKSGRKKIAPTGRSWQWIAEKRAEGDALRKAFGLTLPLADNGSPTGGVHIIEGEAIDEPAVQLSDWAVQALKDDKPVPTKEEAARLRNILHGDDDDEETAREKMARVDTAVAAAREATRIPPPPEEPPDEVVNAADLEPEDKSAEAPPAAPDLPTDWQPFAKQAIETLGYRNVNQVRDALHAQGVERICTALGKLEFDPLDGWALLQDQAPQPKAQQGQML